MSVVIMDGRTRCWWLTACSNILLPTVAEITAGIDFTTFITPDGLDIGWTTGKVPVGNVGSTYNLNRVGRREPSISLTLHHDSPTDVPWTTFVYRATGFWVVRRGIDKATAPIAGQGTGGSNGTVEVFPVECSQDAPSKPAPDTAWDFMTELNVYLDPAPRAVIA